MRKSSFLLIGMGLLLHSTAFAFDKTMSTDDLNQDALNLPGVTIEATETSARIVYSGTTPISIPLYTYLPGKAEDTLVYYAAIKAEDCEGDVYLEMLCTLEGIDYFSRDINNPVTGTSKWLKTSTPFFLDGKKPDKITLGVWMESGGSVLVQNARLHNRATMQILWFNPGAIIGVLGGLSGALVGIFAPRGKFKTGVLSVWFLFITASLLILIVGFNAFYQYGWNEGWPYINAGSIGLALGAALTPLVLKRYREAEERKMYAKDIVNS
jgi:hypothetical protein